MTEHNKYNNIKHFKHNHCRLKPKKTQQENILLDHLIFLHNRYVTSQSTDQDYYCVSPIFYVNIFSSMNRFAQSKGITYNMSIHLTLMNILWKQLENNKTMKVFAIIILLFTSGNSFCQCVCSKYIKDYNNNKTSRIYNLF